MVTIRSRGRLPHWEHPGGIYFVTFRLADSLPKAVHRDLSPTERRRLAELFSEKVESYLDAGSGACVLRESAVAKTVADTLHHFHGNRYQLFAWCVMPNHVHAVFQPLGDWGLAQILHAWKSYSAKEINNILGRSGSLWQHEYYDHLIRHQHDLQRCIRYVAQNPEKAGLPDWPWVGTMPAE